jgi:hypothetical protein
VTAGGSHSIKRSLGRPFGGQDVTKDAKNAKDANVFCDLPLGTEPLTSFKPNQDCQGGQDGQGGQLFPHTPSHNSGRIRPEIAHC